MLGLVSVLTWMLFVPAILAIVFGILGVRDIDSHHTRGRWMAWTGISLAGVVTLFALLAVIRYAAGA